MDRQIVYPGSIPLDTDILSIQRNIMVALSALAQATLGQAPVVDGLACAPTAPASLSVVVAPGSITMFSVLDTLAFGSLPADTASPLVKTGVNLGYTTFTLTAPSGSGESVNYLIQATLSESDATPVVLPYYNAANPTQPFSGPSNSGVAQNTQRLQRVQLQLKPGAAAPAGTQATPPVDNGWVGLYVITVNYGQRQITNSSIATLTTAPFIPFKLPNLAPGFSRMAVFSTPGSSNWIVPMGVTQARFRLVGGGGGGAGGTDTYSGAGGGGGGYAEGVFAVSPGQVIPITVGASGSGAGPGISGGSGGTTLVGSFASASGGQGGGSVNPSSAGGQGGAGYGAPISIAGGWGSDGHSSVSTFAGCGGASVFGGGGRAGSGSGTDGLAPGSGGGGCYESPGNGGNGGHGLVIVEF